MRGLTIVIGIAAVVALATGLNLMILNESMFTSKVLIALITSVGLGCVWLVLYLIGVVRKDSQGSTPYGLNAVIASVAVLVIVVTLYAFVKRTDLSWDLTQEGRQELAPQTKQVLQSLTEPVEAYCIFVKSGDSSVVLAQNKTLRFLERCQQFSDKMNITVLDPQKDVMQTQALSILRVKNVGAVVLKSGEKQKEIPLTKVTSRLEERDFTNTLINVSRKDLQKVYFLDGHGGRDIELEDPEIGGHLFKHNVLMREAYEVGKLLITSQNPTIPEDCSVLVINNYKEDLKPYEINALNQYMAEGGRILCLLEPSVRDKNAPQQERLRPWLKSRFGIDVREDLIASPLMEGFNVMFATDFASLPIEGYVDNDPSGVEFRGSFHATHPITRTIDVNMQMNLARSVTLDAIPPEGIVGTTLLRTTPDTWGETDIEGIMQGLSPSQDGFELKGPNSVAVAVTVKSDRATMSGSRSQDGRIVVIGDSDLASNKNIGIGYNTDLLLNTIAWLTENSDLIAIRPKAGEAVLHLSMGEQRAIVWLSVLGTLQLVVIVGLGTFLFRRRYQ